MKKFLLIAVSTGIILSLSAFFCVANTLFSGKSIKGSGNLITKTIHAPAFDAVRVSRGVKVIITDRVADQISITADDNLMEHVVVKADNQELIVGLNNKLRSISNIHVTVTIPANGRIRSLDASSAAEIRSEVPLKADEFELEASSAAKIETSIEARLCNADASSAAQINATIHASKCDLDASSSAKINAIVTSTDCNLDASSASQISATVESTNCSAGASSAAKIELNGAAAKCEAELSSAARLSASDFVVGDYQIEASSGSNASINCTKTLNGTASSGADISYKGDCQPSISHSSGGSVSKN